MQFIENTNDVDFVDKYMIPRAEESASEIKGLTGNLGTARGIVKIVLNVDDFHKLQPHEVLVTTMTTPDFVMLMRKASAIITDIGGILCHAAIISREINKPCIIGTKFATQILKDGDLVEVDADRGVVTIIERTT